MEAGRGQTGKMNPKDMAKMKVIAAREKFISRPISELDLSACERCGPSYRLLPKNFPKAAASGRSDLARSVLNDDWVSVTSGSEDFSFKAMRKNQYEESLFRCEDDRFEMDMIIETNFSIVRARPGGAPAFRSSHLSFPLSPPHFPCRLSLLRPTSETCALSPSPLPLVNQMDNLAALNAKLAPLSADDRASFKVPEGLLTPVQLRSIERVYGAEHGQEFRELLVRSPGTAVPVILARLRQKDDEWRRVRKDMQKVWADVYEKNIYKSLDHRSFYFKQADKKSLSTKGMLAEVRELSDKRRLSEEGPFVSPSRRGTVLALDMKFDISDRAVHDDAFSIVKYSTGEMMTSDLAQKLINFWVKFFEPFMGVKRAGAADGGFVDNAAELAAAAVAEESKADEKAAKEEKDQRAAAAAAGAGGAEGAEGEKGDGDKGEGKEEETKAEKAAAGGLEEMAEGGGARALACASLALSLSSRLFLRCLHATKNTVHKYPSLLLLLLKLTTLPSSPFTSCAGSEGEGDDDDDDNDDEDKMDEDDEVGFDLSNDRRAADERERNESSKQLACRFFHCDPVSLRSLCGVLCALLC